MLGPTLGAPLLHNLSISILKHIPNPTPPFKNHNLQAGGLGAESLGKCTGSVLLSSPCFSPVYFFFFYTTTHCHSQQQHCTASFRDLVLIYQLLCPAAPVQDKPEHPGGPRAVSPQRGHVQGTKAASKQKALFLCNHNNHTRAQPGAFARCAAYLWRLMRSVICRGQTNKTLAVRFKSYARPTAS